VCSSDLLIATKKLPEERITDLYLRCFSRQPTQAELAKLVPVLGQGNDPTQALGDVFWALLNSREFLFNH